MRINVDPTSANSIICAAKAFAGDNLPMIYIYTEAMRSLWWQEEPVPRMVNQSDLDQLVTKHVPFPGKWWRIDTGHHSGNQSYYLGLDSENRVLTCHYNSEHRFREGDSEFVLAEWEVLNQQEEEYSKYLQDTYPDDTDRHAIYDQRCGTCDRGKWYEGSRWSTPKLLTESITMDLALQAASYYAAWNEELSND